MLRVLFLIALSTVISSNASAAQTTCKSITSIQFSSHSDFNVVFDGCDLSSENTMFHTNSNVGVPCVATSIRRQTWLKAMGSMLLAAQAKNLPVTVEYHIYSQYYLYGLDSVTIKAP